MTDQYVCKTQIASQLSPCNLQEANEVHTFSQVKKLLGEDLVTNGSKLHWLSEKLIRGGVPKLKNAPTKKS